MSKSDYVIRVLESPSDIDAIQWNQLLSRQSQPTPFMRHEYLLALHQSGSATSATGWMPRFMTLSDAQNGVLNPKSFKTASIAAVIGGAPPTITASIFGCGSGLQT